MRRIRDSFSVIVSDAPGSENNPATIVFFVSVFSLPVVCAAAAVSAWALHDSKMDRAARAIVWIPIVDIGAAAAVVCLL